MERSTGDQAQTRVGQDDIGHFFPDEALRITMNNNADQWSFRQTG
jgi:hypothetical protein